MSDAVLFLAAIISLSATAGAYLEHKFGSKVSAEVLARVSAVESRASAAEVRAAVAAGAIERHVKDTAVHVAATVKADVAKVV